MHQFMEKQSSYKYLLGNLSSAVIPGHSYIYERGTGSLLQCNNTLCPYATQYPTSGGGPLQWVNRAPYYGLGSFAG